ncbi:MAG: imidazole glycerol phosphate synthase subunit HisH [Acidobacteria bacterium]|jgi:imidazole glycerol phosphate synthase glutamine amidotransferase subunit|nr:MAG: imidazole glycerol phosphate synthase, glutamine amidotransferase subunit [Acidobacteria bacterium 13_2_20CM_58_27]PYT75334.1 MAG: imidazole glycerol phosphate synthase subunit HisH [Acidobacteriota bacterium]PYT85648.1 MAG: imidazole glycerol phosphate synthase subunit HisH [Acidobacteriota bacterium]
MKVTIIDYGAGNVPSVERALDRLGAKSERTGSPEDISKARVLLLPGVGHYSALVRALDEQNMRAPLVDAIGRGVPFLGICLGLQVLFESSAESPQLRGLSLLLGKVRALPSGVKLPHMGWNQIAANRESRLLAGIDSGAYFYFAHSYAAPDSNGSTAATCFHGISFAAVVEKQNIYGVQFHPEKSGDAGSRLLDNFLRSAA